MFQAIPLSLGQLSVWHDIRDLPPARRHEPNNAAVWTLPADTGVRQVHGALDALARRHPSLRTRYDLTDPDAPRQLPADEAATVALDRIEADPGDAHTVAAELASRPFDLGSEHGWRARLLTHGDTARTLVFVKHHIVADAWAQELLRVQLSQALAGAAPTPVAEAPAPGPAELAAEQFSEAGLSRQAAALRHWERLHSDTPRTALPHRPADRGTAVQATLRSAPALSAARVLADRAGVSVACVVLAAYARSVARLCADGQAEPEALHVQLMSSNRFTPRWKGLVTSMNQWAPALLPLPPATNLVGLARAAHWSSLTAFRHGMHDVTAVARLRDRAAAPEPTCAYNFVALPDGAPAADATTAPDPGDQSPTLRWETPFTTIGPRCYARADDIGGVLSVRLTVRDLGRDQAAALLWDLHARLLAEGKTA
ncbi:condensation domain-containing protein [Streptomyces sp. NBC_00555]|uniref:condensation domain-containing protein n=1 Tax=Streptomyces sp. NBC_00555 TaxID=2903662 RepID=UPI0022593AF4|nr:condensation domain-containing protein [Streptomyces sp. NBC_00555]MCX5015515.1 condensation domain-containing protein [Streptomyces sp. NBC_00555]